MAPPPPKTFTDTRAVETTPPTRERSDPSVATIFVLTTLVLVLFLCAFGRAALERREWLNFDDYENFRDNDHIHALNIGTIRWAFEEGIVLGVYEPLSIVFKSLVWSKCLLPDATSFVRVSVLLHAVNAIVAHALARQVLGSLTTATSATHRNHRRDICCAAAALFWACHPLRVEAVVWASAQPYLLASVSSCLCACAHLRFVVTEKRRYALLALCLYTISVLFKAASISVALALPLFDLLIGRRGRRRRRRRRTFVHRALLYASYLIVALSAVRRSMLIQESAALLRDLSLVERVERAAYALCFYLAKTLVPTGLRGRYPVPSEMSLYEIRFGGSTIVVVALSLLAMRVLLRHARSTRVVVVVDSDAIAATTKTALAAAWVGYVTILLPTLGIVSNHVWGLAADRYAYLPSMLVGVPFIAAVAEHATARASHTKRACLLACVAAILTSLAFRCDLEARSWRAPDVFWNHMIATDPADAVPYNNYGNILVREGRSEEAIGLYRKALELIPDYTEAWFNLANATLSSASVKSEQAFKVSASEAADMIIQGLRTEPTYPVDFFNLAALLERVDRYEEASDILQQLAEAPSHRARARTLLRALKTKSTRKRKKEARRPKHEVTSSGAIDRDALRDKKGTLPKRRAEKGKVTAMQKAAGRLIETRNFAAARRLLERAVEIDPQSPALQELLKRAQN